MIIYILGKMLGVEGALLLIPAVVSLIYGEKTGISFLAVAAVLGVIYLVLGRRKPKNNRIYGKEGFAVVGLAWVLWSLFGALPFVISGTVPNYVDAFFETVSGFTTTGSTILQEIESLPRGINFWRCFTHWIGGMGVLVFVMMVTSLDDENAMPLMRAEVPGPEADKLVPKARSTARILYQMYFALTAVEVVLLMFGGMNLYDALVHSFSTAGTGGFSNRNSSVAFYDSAYIDGVITVFMILFGINFNLYFLLLLKNWKSALKNVLGREDIDERAAGVPAHWNADGPLACMWRAAAHYLLCGGPHPARDIAADDIPPELRRVRPDGYGLRRGGDDGDHLRERGRLDGHGPAAARRRNALGRLLWGPLLAGLDECAACERADGD